MTRPDESYIKFCCRLCNKSFTNQTDQLNHFKDHRRVIEEGSRHKASSANPGMEMLLPEFYKNVRCLSNKKLLFVF